MDAFERHSKTGVLSKLLFWWTIPILKKGRKGLLSDADLQILPTDLEYLPDRVEKMCKREFKLGMKQKLKATTVMYTILNMVKVDLLFSFLMCFTRQCILALALPLMLGHLLKQIKSETYEIYKEVQVASVVIMILLLMPIVRSLFTRYAFLCGIKSRYVLNAFLYYKVLRLTTVQHSEISSGKIINLMTSSFCVIDRLFLQVCFIPATILQNIIATIIIRRQFGPSSSAGVLIFMLVIPVQFLIGRIAFKYRSTLSTATDERIKIINDILKGIKVIKMCCWENIFVKIISDQRRRENACVSKLMLILSLNSGISQQIIKLVTLLIITMFLLNKGEFEPDRVFTLLSIFYTVKRSQAALFSRASSTVSATITSLQRLQLILDVEEALTVTTPFKDGEKLNPETFISIKNVDACWKKDVFILKNVDFYASNYDFVTIVGTVGSGKSSLLLVILKELRIRHGSVKVSGSIAYVPQEPWIFSDTLVKNITFGKKFDQKKFDEIIMVCALNQDVKALPNGYYTSVGERGTKLSGGQRARVSLARALYQDATIYILDDPLSAVDANVGRHIHQECFNKYLKNKMRILVTTQLQYVQDSGMIIFMEEGIVKFHGTCSEALKDKCFGFKRYLKHVRKNTDQKRKIDSTVKAMSEDDKTSSFTHCIEKKVNNDSNHNDCNLWKVYQSFFNVAGNICYLYTSVALTVFTGFLFVGSDYWLKFWMRKNSECGEIRRPFFETCLENSTCALPNVNISIYSYYRTTYSDHCTIDHPHSYYFAIYGVLITSTIICGLVRNVLVTFICVKIARKLHDKMLRRVIFAPMYFFNTKPIGRLLNVFTHDMMIVDTRLPISVSNFSNGVCMIVVALSMVYTERIQIVCGTVLLCLGLQNIEKFYVPTMRALQRIKSKRNSSVCSHLSISLDGLTTIRAHRATERYFAIFNNLQSAHIASSYIVKSVSIWFTLYGELICALQMILVILLFVIHREDHSPESAGFIIAQMIKMFSLIPFVLTQSTTFRNDFISAERILAYTRLPTERHRLSSSDDESDTVCENTDIGINWPQTGSIEFKSVFLKYSDDGIYALKDISFDIRNGEKIGIIGRTGAGKTSLVSAIFKIMDFQGTIRIDGVDISRIQLEDLRCRLSVIPQEPFLFIGTLRYNLDPYEEYEDDTLWKTLKDVQLDHVVLKLPNGLNTKVAEGGLNFSFGQRQLICLARVLLRRNKILILDEATANVDIKTDQFIQETIRTTFKECTVITIAHRLNSVINCNRVMVMDHGRIVEFAPPKDLLENRHSQLFKFAQDARLI
ncbi:ABCC4 (predicted) [Pycnogonum litorale]